MKAEELKKLADEMDNWLGPIHARWAPEAIIMRIGVETALQLAILNEEGISLAGIAMRNQNLCVSVEMNNC